MKPLACFLFILVFIVITTYLLSLVLIHVFSEKIKDTAPQSVVVHIHKKNGKKNKVLITNPDRQHNTTTTPTDNIEGFLGDTKCTSCSNLSGKKPLKQIITPPKNNRKSTKDKKSRSNNKSKKKSNNPPKKSKKSKKIKEIKEIKEIKKEVNIIEAFSGDDYLLNYRNNFQKLKNKNKQDGKFINCNAYNKCEYY